MIVVSCGTEKYPFDRLVKVIDFAVKNGIIKEKVLIQSNAFNYKPLYCDCRKMLPYDEFVDVIKQANVYVCHGGVGAIMVGVFSGKKPMVVPRYKKLGENVDDHQVQIAIKLSEENIITPCFESDNVIEKIKDTTQEKIDDYKSPGKDNLLSFLEKEILL